MKILYVLHDFFPRFYGGTERYVLNLSRQMQRMGHSVEVLTYGIDDPLESYNASFGDIHYKSYIYKGVPVVSIRHKMIPADVGYIVEDEKIENAISRLIKDKSYDILHIAHPMRIASCYKVAKRLGIPVVFTVTDFWLLCPRGRFYKPDYSLCNSPESGGKCIRECAVNTNVLERYERAKRMFYDVDIVISPSRFLIEIFKSNGWNREIIHINHGVDYKNVKPFAPIPRQRDKVVFAYTGVVTRFKGADLLINTFMEAESNKIILKIYGNCIWDIEMNNILNAAIKKDKKIFSMGKYEHIQLPEIMKDVDIVVVPSTTLESYGLVVIESMAYGVPVIASDIVGSAYEFIMDGKNGFIFPINKPHILKDIINKISNNPGIIKDLKENIIFPPRIEEEAFIVESLYKRLS